MFNPGRFRRTPLALLLVMPLTACHLPQRVFAPDAYFHDRAVEYVEQGLDEQALRAFTRAIEQNPRLVEAHMGLGAIHRKLGSLVEASNAYRIAAELAPMSFDAHYHLGEVQHLMGRFADATRAYLQALAIAPDDFDTNNNLATVYLQQGRPGMAIPFAERATQIAPDDQAAWVNLASALSLDGQLDEAVNAYRHAAELGAIDTPILLGLADAHIRLEHYDRARIVLAAQIRQAPSALAHERMGYVLYKARRYEDALEHYRQAVTLAPDDTAALNGLGVSLMTLYLHQHRLVKAHRDEALDAWRRSLEVDINQPRIRSLLRKYTPRG